VGAGALVFSGAGLLAATSASATSTFSFTRINGHDRYDTSAKIADKTFPSGVDTVIIASGENNHYPDSLAGNYLAGAQGSGAPVLLVKKNTIPDKIQAAINKLDPTNAIIVGGYGAVSTDVTGDLQQDGLTVTRVKGHDRYDTMKAVDEAVSDVGKAPNGKTTAIIANGQNFPDALASGPIAYHSHFPIVLVKPKDYVSQAKAVLADDHIDQVIISGGFAAVSKDVEAKINSDGVSTLKRARGSDRSDTAKILADFAIGTLNYSDTHLNLATGQPSLDGVDALSAGPHAATDKTAGTPLLITNTRDKAGSAVDFAKEHCHTLADGHLFGGPKGAISDSTATAVSDAAKCSNNATVTVDTKTPTAGKSLDVTVTPSDSSRTITSVEAKGSCIKNGDQTISNDADNSTDGFQASFATDSSAAGASCDVTFTVTFNDGTTQDVSQTVKFAKAAGVTTSPELTSAKILGTVPTGAGTTANPAGTTVQYTFDESVENTKDTTNADKFHVVAFDTTPYTGAKEVSTDGNVVKILFTDTALQKNPGTAGSAVGDLSVATVESGNKATTSNPPNNTSAVADNDGEVNPEGDAPIGSGETATSGPQSGVTDAPDLTKAGNFRQAQTGQTAVDFTFDHKAFSQSASGYDVVLTDGSTVTCTGPAAGASGTASGGNAAGGNGTDTFTVTCDNPGGVVGLFPGTKITADNTARGVVGNNTVGTEPPNGQTIGGTSGEACTTSTTSTGNACNPLETAAVSNNGNSDSPDLVSVAITQGTGSGATATDDTAIYTFDEKVKVTGSGSDFHAYNPDGTQVPGTGTPVANGTGSPAFGTQVKVDFGSDTALDDAVGASVDQNAVKAQTTADGGTGNNNQADEVGVTPQGTPPTPLKAGQTEGPDLTGVSITPGSTSFGTQTLSKVTYTFDKKLTTGAVDTDFHLYLSNNDEVSPGNCTVNTNTTSKPKADHTVTCTATSANSDDAAKAVLGTVERNGVTHAVSNTSDVPNPIGAEATSGGTGTPQQ
jgi:putative cell wall-binding protein